jgi:hypothetical protein
MNTRTVVATAIACLLASPWALAQYAKDSKGGDAKPSAASEMPNAAAEDSKAPGKAAGPRLNMDVPKKNPGKDQDVRSCLDLATNAEIIKCAQKK